MKDSSVEHLLSALPKKLSEYKTIVDVSPNSDIAAVRFLESDIVVLDCDPKLIGKCDCVICYSEEDLNENFDQLLKSAKEFLSPQGFFALCLCVPIEVSQNFIISKFRFHGFSIAEMAFDRKSKVLNCTFLLTNNVTSPKENIVKHAENKTVCTRITPKCVTVPGFNIPDCCQAHLRELLWFVVDSLDAYEIPYWIDGGTLLGAARDGEFIKWNNNVNISILKSEEKKLKSLSKHFLINGYEFTSSVGRYAVQYSRINKIALKIKVWTDGEILFDGNRRISKANILPLKEVTLNERSFKCPNLTEKVLELMFGADWKCPRNSLGIVTSFE